MAHHGIGAAALIFGELNPVMVQGAVTAGVPIGAGIEQRAFDELVTDTLVRFDPAHHSLTVLDRTHGVRPPRTDAQGPQTDA
jgi:predicted aconitase with swiveling domain